MVYGRDPQRTQAIAGEQASRLLPFCCQHTRRDCSRGRLRMRHLGRTQANRPPPHLRAAAPHYTVHKAASRPPRARRALSLSCPYRSWPRRLAGGRNSRLGRRAQGWAGGLGGVGMPPTITATEPVQRDRDQLARVAGASNYHKSESGRGARGGVRTGAKRAKVAGELDRHLRLKKPARAVEDLGSDNVAFRACHLRRRHGYPKGGAA